MREMFGAQSVRWSANLLEEKIEISVDSSTAIVDANTLVSVVIKTNVCGCHNNRVCKFVVMELIKD